VALVGNRQASDLADLVRLAIGQVACLTVSDQSHMARCDLVLNNTSWTKIGDTCPDNTMKPHLKVTPISMPAPSMVPTEPTAN